MTELRPAVRGALPHRLDVRHPVGLLAAAGRFPVVFAAKMRSLGLPLVCVGLRDMAEPELRTLATSFTWCGVSKLGRMIRCFRRAGVRTFVMAGKVPKTRIIGAPWRWWRLGPDWRMIRMWFGRRRDN